MTDTLTETIFLVTIMQIITATSVLFVWVVRYENIIKEFLEAINDIYVKTREING